MQEREKKDDGGLSTESVGQDMAKLLTKSCRAYAVASVVVVTEGLTDISFNDMILFKT